MGILLDPEQERRDDYTWINQQPTPSTPAQSSAPTPQPTSGRTPEQERLYQQAIQGGQTPDSIAAFLKTDPGDYHRLATRLTPTEGRQFDSQSSAYNQQTNQLARPAPSVSYPGTAGSQSRSVPGQFSDPITSYLEQFAQQRAQRLENPPEDSGQAMLEQALKSMSQQFQQGGFTPAEQEIFQTQALDPLEQLRTSRKQQVMETLSRRGITPTSGVAIQMLQDVDRQFDSLRAQQQRSIAGQAAEEKTSRMMQALQQLSALAGTENQRLDQAFQYRTVPMNLADRSFNQAFQLYNAAGNPLSLINPMMAQSALQQNRNDSFQSGLAELIWMLTQGGNRGA